MNCALSSGNLAVLETMLPSFLYDVHHETLQSWDEPSTSDGARADRELVSQKIDSLPEGYRTFSCSSTSKV